MPPPTKAPTKTFVELTCEVCGRVFTNRGPYTMHVRKHEREQAGEAGSASAAPPAAGAGPYDSQLPGLEDAEAAPQVRRRGNWRQRMWGGPKTGDGAPAPRTRERRPKVASGKRESVADVLSMLYGGGGTLLEYSGRDVPVGRFMQVAGPYAGESLDRAVAGTFLDRPLQRFAGARFRDLEDASVALGAPILIAIVERAPRSAVVLEPIIKQFLRRMFVGMVPVIKKRQADEAAYAAAVADLGIELTSENLDGTTTTIDPVEGLWEMLFSPQPMAAEPAPASVNGDGAAV